MTKETQVLLVLLELLAVFAVVMVLLPLMTERCALASHDWAESQRAKQASHALREKAEAIAGLKTRLGELLTESSKYGLGAQDLNRLSQELASMVGASNLRLERLQHREGQPLLKGQKEVGKRLICFVDVTGTYAGVLHFLWLQKERLPSLNVDRLRLRRNQSSAELTASISFSAPIFSAPAPARGTAVAP